MKDYAPTSQGGDYWVTPQDQGAEHLVVDKDGWQESLSDKEDYLKLTQSYVDGCSTSLTTEEDEFRMKEGDQRRKEDDRVESDSSEEDKDDYIPFVKLLSSCKEVEDGNRPHSGLVQPTDQPKQEDGGHTVLSDSVCGADITTTVVAVTERRRGMGHSDQTVER